MLPPERPFLTQICTKSFVGWGFAPDHIGAAYSASPDTLAILGGLLLREEMEEEGRYRAEKEKGKGRRGKGGKEGEGPMTLWHGPPIS